MQLPAKRKPEPFTGGEGTGTLLWGVARATRAAVRRLYNVDNERNAALESLDADSAISPSIRFDEVPGSENGLLRCPPRLRPFSRVLHK